MIGYGFRRFWFQIGIQTPLVRHGRSMKKAQPTSRHASSASARKSPFKRGETNQLQTVATTYARSPPIQRHSENRIQERNSTVKEIDNAKRSNKSNDTNVEDKPFQMRMSNKIWQRINHKEVEIMPALFQRRAYKILLTEECLQPGSYYC